MKQLISAIKNTHIQRQAQSLTWTTSTAHFSTKNDEPKPNSVLVDEKSRQMLKKEREDFEKLSEKQKVYIQAKRLLELQEPERLRTDQSLWWNRIESMSEEEARLLPTNFVMKFGSYLHRLEENRMLTRLETNRSLDMYTQVRNLKSLLTNEEKEALQARKDMLKEGDTSFKYELDGYMTRQPRLDLSKYNYNFEQFRQFTALYEECKKKDQAELRSFYKMVKYSQENLSKGDQSAINFAKKFRLDLIEIPEVFKHLSTDDIVIKKDKRSRRPLIKLRTNTDLRNYDAWRTHDREVMKSAGKMPCASKIMIPPAILVKIFGMPTETRTGFEGTGEYDFEDTNLDCFNLADYKQTDFYWGLNREDEYYDKYLHKPPNKRRQKMPTIQEFWTSMEPKMFKIYCQEHADYRKFRKWLRKTIKLHAGREIPFDEEINQKYRHEIDVCLGDYEEKGVVNTDMAVFKWDSTYFMSEDEAKKWTNKPEQITPVKAFDLTQAERVFITKEEIKMREQMEQEKLKQI